MSNLVILLATKNKGKITEFKNMLKEYPVEIKTLYDYDIPNIEETGSSFSENALIKARAGYLESGLITIADDSGLEVDELNGEPGIYSARYGNKKTAKERNDLLLENMKNCKNRKARFKASLVLYISENEYFNFDGVWEGEILKSPVGENGFGYDPIFYDPKLKRASAELTKEEKRAVSHRGQAMDKLVKNLSQLFRL